MEHIDSKKNRGISYIKRNDNSDIAYYTVSEVIKISRLARSTVYAMCKRGYLPNAKVGSRVLIPKEKFHERLRELERQPV